MKEQAPVVLVPCDEHMGLDIARSLGKRGIPVYGVDSDPNAPAGFSKYVHFVHGPDSCDGEADFIKFLVDLGGQLGERAVLYPLSDRCVLLVSRHRAVLQEYYEFVMPDHETMERLTTKDGLHAIAQETNVLSPQTIRIEKAGDNTIFRVAEQMAYPVILKPIESTYWHTREISGKLSRGLLSGRPKVVCCANPEELCQAYHRIAIYDSRLVVQEVVPGEDGRLVYFSFYLDRESKPLAIFAGRKERVIPTGFGSATYVRSFYDSELRDIALKFLSAVRYQGLGGLEFKRDPRSDTYQLIEFNTRFGMWDGFGAGCGVDLAYTAYCDALHVPVEPQFSYCEGLIWVDWQRDLRASVEYWRQGRLSLGEWLRSWRGEKVWAIYAGDDWRPGAVFTWKLAQKLWGRISTTAGIGPRECQ